MSTQLREVPGSPGPDTRGPDENGVGASDAALVRARKRSFTPFSLGSVVLALALAALAVYPLIALVGSIAAQGGAPIVAAFTQPDLGELILNTLVVVGVSTAIALVIGALLAWVNERTDASLGAITDAMPMIPFMLPPIAGAIGWVLLLSPQAGYLNGFIRSGLDLVGVHLDKGPFDIYTWYGLILVYTIYAVPYSFMMCSAGLRNFDPALEEQSRVSGAGLWRTLRKVTIPGMLPSILGAALLILWSGFGLFSIPAVIGKGANINILSVRIVDLLSFTFPPKIGAAVGLCLIVVVFVAIAWWLQSRVLKGGRFSTIGGKGQRATRIKLGKAKLPVRILVLAYVGITTVLPILALVIVSLNGYWTLNIRWAKLSLNALFQAVFQDVATQQALQNSLMLGLVGATIGIAAAAIVSLYVVRSGSKLARFLDGAIKLPSTLSHIVIAVGFVLAFAGAPFHLGGTILILLLAYIALYLPQAAVSADTAVGQVGPELAEASRVAGAGEGRTFRKIYAPLMLPGLIAGWALLFVRMIGDLTASSILAGTNNNVVGFRILEIYQNGSFSLLASLSTVLTVISAVIVIGVLVFSRRSERQGRKLNSGGPIG